jgi:hypothetical protein
MDPNSVIITRMQNLIFRYENAFFIKNKLFVILFILCLVAIGFSIFAFIKGLQIEDIKKQAEDGEKASQFLTYLFPEYVNFIVSN